MRGPTISWATHQVDPQKPPDTLILNSCMTLPYCSTILPKVQGIQGHARVLVSDHTVRTPGFPPFFFVIRFEQVLFSSFVLHFAVVPRIYTTKWLCLEESALELYSLCTKAMESLAGI